MVYVLRPRQLHVAMGCCRAGAEYYTKVSKGRGQMPAVFIIYDMFSLAVAVADSRRSLAHFLVRVCAVLGGVFAVTGGYPAGCFNTNSKKSVHFLCLMRPP